MWYIKIESEEQVTKNRPGTFAVLFLGLAIAIPLIVIPFVGETSITGGVVFITSLGLLMPAAHFASVWFVSRFAQKEQKTLLGVVAPKKDADQGVLYDENDIPSI